MELYPGSFDSAVPNTSEDFDIVELGKEQINSTKVVPRLLEPVEEPKPQSGLSFLKDSGTRKRHQPGTEVPGWRYF